MENPEIDKKDWSEADHRINRLTGFIPGPRNGRKCISCGEAGHYYTECNGGQFLKAVDALVEGIKLIQ